MKTISTNTLNLMIVSSLFLCISACTKTPEPQNISAESLSQTRPLTGVSQNGHFNVSIQPKIPPVVLNQIHDWTLRLTQNNGTSLGQATIKVYGGMPQHQHSFPTVPKITQYLGDGNYLIEGVKFSMPGEWKIGFSIEAAGKEDEVEFFVQL